MKKQEILPIAIKVLALLIVGTYAVKLAGGNDTVQTIVMIGVAILLALDLALSLKNIRTSTNA